MRGGGASTWGIGFTLKQVVIREIDPRARVARCVDTEGTWVDVATSVQRTGITPRAGQTWLVDRELSTWTLRALLALEPVDLTQWQPLILKNGWQPSTAEWDTKPEARVTAEGTILVRGVIKGGTVPAPSTALTVATLPPGFPAHYTGRATLPTALTTGVSTPVLRGTLHPSGDITITPWAAGTPDWIDLDRLQTHLT